MNISNNLLDNELVKKYFGCEAWGCNAEFEGEPKHRNGIDCRRMSSDRILDAMQQKIEKGQSFLRCYQHNECDKPWIVELSIATDEVMRSDYNATMCLRLPERFQPKKQSEVSQKCGCGLTWDTIHRFDGPCHVLTNKPQSIKDEVEEKIQDITNFDFIGWQYEGKIVKALRDLVRLVREEAMKRLDGIKKEAFEMGAEAMRDKILKVGYIADTQYLVWREIEDQIRAIDTKGLEGREHE